MQRFLMGSSAAELLEISEELIKMLTSIVKTGDDER